MTIQKNYKNSVTSRQTVCLVTNVYFRGEYKPLTLFHSTTALAEKDSQMWKLNKNTNEIITTLFWFSAKNWIWTVYLSWWLVLLSNFNLYSLQRMKLGMIYQLIKSKPEASKNRAGESEKVYPSFHYTRTIEQRNKTRRTIFNTEWSMDNYG